MSLLRPVLLTCCIAFTLAGRALSQNFWQQTNGPYGGTVLGLAINSNGNLYAGTYVGGVYRSTDSGASWAKASSSLADPYLTSLAINASNPGGYIFTGGVGGGVFRSTQSTTGVESIGGQLPPSFGLQQNYPNPFNPGTVISFQLPVASLVTLKIYNVLGQEVATLVNGDLKPGNHETRFDATNLAAGVYFYRLLAHPISDGKAGSFTETKKLLLLK